MLLQTDAAGKLLPGHQTVFITTLPFMLFSVVLLSVLSGTAENNVKSFRVTRACVHVCMPHNIENVAQTDAAGKSLAGHQTPFITTFPVM